MYTNVTGTDRGSDDGIDGCFEIAISGSISADVSTCSECCTGTDEIRTSVVRRDGQNVSRGCCDEGSGANVNKSDCNVACFGNQLEIVSAGYDSGCCQRIYRTDCRVYRQYQLECSWPRHRDDYPRTDLSFEVEFGNAPSEKYATVGRKLDLVSDDINIAVLIFGGTPGFADVNGCTNGQRTAQQSGIDEINEYISDSRGQRDPIRR